MARATTWHLYRWFDGEGALLYVGITRDPELRERQHRNHSRWTIFAARYEVAPTVYEWKADAVTAEAAAVRTEDPVFNRQGRRGWHARQTAYVTARGLPSTLVPPNTEKPLVVRAPKPRRPVNRSRPTLAAEVQPLPLSERRYVIMKDLAALAGVGKSTISTYVSRKQMPPPRDCPDCGAQAWPSQVAADWIEKRQQRRALRENNQGAPKA